MDRTERQKLGVRKWIDSGCRGTLNWSTGVGKSRAALMAMKSFLAYKNGSVKIIVPTENLKNQWINELVKYNLLNCASVEIINTAIKSSDKTTLLILDECHRYGSDQFFQIFKHQYTDQYSIL